MGGTYRPINPKVSTAAGQNAAIVAELSDEMRSEILDQLFQEWLRDEM